MTMQTRLGDLITQLGTDYKTIKTWLFGSITGSLADLETTDKASIVDAINEARTTGGSGTPPDASETVKGITELATDAEALAMTTDAAVLTPGNIGAITNVNNGIPKLDGTGKVGSAQLPTTPDASETVKGISELATDAEALAMSTDAAVLTPGNIGAITNVNNGLAKLDATGKVAAAQLPSYVDDTLEAANFAGLPGTGETGKIYVTLNDNKTYRWSGSAYVEISASPGSTDSVTEGATNLYFTNARADARADARIAALVGDTDTDLAALYATAKA